MSSTEQSVKSCQGCGAMIYPEHVEEGKAGLWGGKLLCPMCYKEHAAGPYADSASASAAEPEPIAMVSETEVTPARKPKIQAFAASGAGGGQAGAEQSLRRGLAPDAHHASRCRTFHAKLNEGAIAFMNNQVNEWCDSNEGITIKFATSTIGVFEGKHADPHLILTVFY